MSKPSSSGLRALPAVGRVVAACLQAGWVGEGNHEEIAGLAREVVHALRADLITGRRASSPTLDEVCGLVRARFLALRQSRIPTMINATGIVLHTGLGRALLPPGAAEAAARVAGRYCGLALDMETGGRGERDDIAEALVCRLTGAESATFACNNAAATLLVLAALCSGREVPVSRGHLIEIGGAFRLPDVMAQSGALLREVGTTNKTHLRDYERAITESTAALLFVHMSNYRIVGFTAEPALARVAVLAHEHHLPLLHDLGSGALVDLSRFGLEREPLVQDSFQAGADVVFFSGDKLIGGPQCGIIAGRRDLVDSIRRHPLARAVRVGKLTLATLEATLQLFLNPERLVAEHPLYRMLATPADTLRQRAQKAAKYLQGHGLHVEVVPSEAQLGSGSLPGQVIPSWALAITHDTRGEEEIARRLRQGAVPVIVRRSGGRVLADLRTVLPDEVEELVNQVRAAVL